MYEYSHIKTRNGSPIKQSNDVSIAIKHLVSIIVRTTILWSTTFMVICVIKLKYYQNYRRAHHIFE